MAETKYDWFDDEKIWLGRVVYGKRGSVRVVRDINVPVVSAILGMTPDDYMRKMYIDGFLTGKALQEQEEKYGDKNESQNY